jgi:hypothetical protein
VLERRTEKTHDDMEVNIPTFLDLLDLKLQVIEHTVCFMFVILDFYVTRRRIVVRWQQSEPNENRELLTAAPPDIWH